jgi:hypothetical protein
MPEFGADMGEWGAKTKKTRKYGVVYGSSERGVLHFQATIWVIFGHVISTVAGMEMRPLASSPSVSAPGLVRQFDGAC